MVNILMLRGKVVENGLTLNDLASYLHIDYSTLSRKLKNSGETFSIYEANKITDILNLTEQEAVAIFFKKYVA